MKEKDKKRALEMFAMRLEGASYQEIADKYGCSKQNVEQLLKMRESSKISSTKKYEICIYKGFREWLEQNRYKLVDLQRFIMESECKQCSNSLRYKLSGKRDFKISEIFKIIKLTGMTFEELFMQTESVE